MQQGPTALRGGTLSDQCTSSNIFGIGGRWKKTRGRHAQTLHWFRSRNITPAYVSITDVLVFVFVVPPIISIELWI